MAYGEFEAGPISALILLFIGTPPSPWQGKPQSNDAEGRGIELL